MQKQGAQSISKQLQIARRLRVVMPLIMIGLTMILEVAEQLSYSQGGTSEGLHHGMLLELILFGLIGPTLVFLGFHWVTIMIQDLEAVRSNERELHAKLEEEAAVTQALLAQTIQVQEAERQRVARELHDSIGQHLTAFLLVSQMADRTDNDALTVHAEKAATNALESMRRLILDLRPALLDAQGLMPAIRQSAEDALCKHGILLDVKVSGRARPLPPDAETALFRISQEAFTNILHHAGAENVWVEMVYTAETAVLQIRDDGCGFVRENGRVRPSGNGSTGLGLLSMRERAAQVGAALVVASTAGEGTMITVTVPLETAVVKEMV